MGTSFFSTADDVDEQSSPVGFFGQVVGPEFNTTDALLETLDAKIVTVQASSDAAVAAAAAAALSEANSAIAESNISQLSQSASNTLSLANSAIATANATVASTNAAATSATNSQTAAAASAGQAASSATAAANSATAASSSQTAAAGSATAASSSQTAAAGSATAAANSASNAASSASSASTQATNSASSATAAANSATQAASSVTSAATQASTATSQANTATTQASNAASSAAAALASQNAAATSATNSANSATASANSASQASTTAANLNALLTLPITSTAMTLTGTQFLNGIIECTGALTGNTIITVPATSHPFMLINNTTGNYTLTVQMTGGGQSATVVQGYAGNLCCDGINGVYAASSAGGNANAQLVPVTPVAGATFISFAHVPGFAWLMLRGVFLVPGTDYTDSASGFTLQGFSADGTEGFAIFSLNTVSIANALTAASPTISSGALTFPDGSQQSTAPMGRNRIINGDFRVAQYPNASQAYAAGQQGYCGPDRFYIGNGAGTGGTMAQSTATMTIGGLVENAVQQYVGTPFTSIAGTSAASGVTQVIEGFNAYDLVGQQVTISFWFQATVAGTYGVALRDGATNYGYATTFAYNTAGTPQRVVVTVPVLPSGMSVPRSNTAGLTLNIGALNTGTYQNPTTGAWSSGGNYFTAPGVTNWSTVTNNYIAVARLQLEAGNTLNPVFERVDYSEQLRRCLRYFNSGSAWVQLTTYAAALASANHVSFPVTMRSTPAMSITPAAFGGVGYISPNTHDIDSWGFSYNFNTGQGVNTTGRGQLVWTASSEF